MTEKLFLIDAMAMIYRAYFAMISRPLINSKGINTSAVFGFINSLIKILEEENPEHIAVCFDTEKPTFRHEEFPAYKAQRQEIPTDMPWQIDKVKEIVNSFNIPLLEVAGYEADDIIGTLVKQAEKENVKSYMVTSDKDFMQLVSDKIFLYKPRRNLYGNRVTEVEIVDRAGVEKKFGVGPDKVIEVLGLMGDASDNIPGIKGVGEKTAISLIQEFGSIDNLYKNIEKVTKPKLKENLIKHKKEALLSKKLVTIITDVPLKKNFHELNRKDYNKEELIEHFEELEFKSLVKKISTTDKPAKEKKTKKDEEIKISIKGQKVIDIKVDIPETQTQLQTISNVKHHYYTIKNHDEYERFIKQLSEQELISFDTETDSTNPRNTNLVGFSVSYKEKEAFYVPVHGSFKSNKKSDGTLFGNGETAVGSKKNDVEINFALKKLKPILENDKIRKVGQNIKFDYIVMRNYGIEIQNLFFDSLIGAYILSSEGRHDMDTLSEKYLGYKPISIEELIGKGKTQITMDKVQIDKISEYAAEDADVTLQLFHRLKYELQKINNYKLCSEIEFPLIRVLAEMEYEGIKVDGSVLKVIDKELVKLISDYEQKIYDIAGEVFNINSTQQLSKILFDKLKLTPARKTKTGFSTDVRVLEELQYQHEIASVIVDYRTLTKLKTTYVDGLLKAINPKTGRVHTSFNQVIAATGRLSSVNPNLQNIPIRTEAGRSIRKAFIPEEKGYMIVSADYSQIELRIMAHCSNDENFINAFKRNRDIHAETAMRVFDVKAKKDVTDNMRRKAKEVNFGIIYGIGAFGLANRLEIKNSEAKEIIDRYFREYPKVKEYMEETKKFARENGYVETLKGRRRYLPQINNQNANARAEDERAAINMPIQGTAADMIKIAMINIFNAFKKHNLESKMLLQVHDELVFEVKEEEFKEVKRIVLRDMRNAIKLNVPIEVEIETGKNWFDAHK
ncbi:MAG: DNA polymerase I [Bacteroidetes bacterium]|nr:DNA polymerase I [Bacteroidota bacterium]